MSPRVSPRGSVTISLLVRRGVALVLGVLIVGSVAALGYQAVHREGLPWRTENPAQAARDTVTGQARAFMKRVNTYGPNLVQGATMPAYRSGVAELVTAKFKSDFEQNVPYAEATVTQTGVDRSTTIYAAGVGDLDVERGRATVLVAGDLTNSFPDAKRPSDAAKRVAASPQPYRVSVSLVRQGGQWRVDDFSPVGAEAQQVRP